MNICVDENIPLVTIQELRNLGHDVLDIRGTADQGMSDEMLWARALLVALLFGDSVVVVGDFIRNQLSLIARR
jgi:hypothetical protein